MTDSTTPSGVRSPDPAQATDATLARNLAAFKALEPELRAMLLEAVRTPNSDIEGSAIAALAAVAHVRERGRLEHVRSFVTPKALPPDVDVQLERAARALLHLHSLTKTDSAVSNSIKVDPALTAEADERKKRMVKLLSYWFEDDAAVQAELRDITPGSGYTDTASDLQRLARLYELKCTSIIDSKNFRADDAKRAQANADAIIDSIANEERARLSELGELRNRTWTVLADLYDRLQMSNAIAYRKNLPEREAIPPLRAAVHGAGTKAKTSSVATGTGGTSPTEPTPTPIAPADPVPEGHPDANPFP